MPVPFLLFTVHYSLPEGPISHAARGGNGCQKCRERGYYYLHRNLNDLFLHTLILFRLNHLLNALAGHSISPPE